jgi:hypothetical protein
MSSEWKKKIRVGNSRLNSLKIGWLEIAVACFSLEDVYDSSAFVYFYTDNVIDSHL